MSVPPADIWRMPANFPVEKAEGLSFSGMMTPAVDSAYGEFAFYTEEALTGEFSIGKKIESVRAYAIHSFVIREWTIHYVEGLAATAEYRERERGKIKEGDRAGEDSGGNPIKRLRVFKAVDGKFNISDKELAADLAEILTKAKPKSEHVVGGNGG